jgi:hypothetical protein
MLLDDYEARGLLYNSNFKEVTTSGAYTAYRGDLVLVEGEIADEQGRRKPPEVGMLAAVMLTDADRIKLVAGSIDDLADITAFLGKYHADFAPDLCAVLYVVNIAKPMRLTVDGAVLSLIPMTDGLVWTELMDEFKLEKSDFKGQSGGDKVLTVLQASKDYKPRYEAVTLDEALSRTIAAKREARGPV